MRAPRSPSAAGATSASTPRTRTCPAVRSSLILEERAGPPVPELRRSPLGAPADRSRLAGRGVLLAAADGGVRARRLVEVPPAHTGEDFAGGVLRAPHHGGAESG